MPGAAVSHRPPADAFLAFEVVAAGIIAAVGDVIWVVAVHEPKRPVVLHTTGHGTVMESHPPCLAPAKCQAVPAHAQHGAAAQGTRRRRQAAAALTSVRPRMLMLSVLSTPWTQPTHIHSATMRPVRRHTSRNHSLIIVCFCRHVCIPISGGRRDLRRHAACTGGVLHQLAAPGRACPAHHDPETQCSLTWSAVRSPSAP